MISGLITKLQGMTDLSYDEMRCAMSGMLGGETTEQQNVDFLSCLAEKKETDDELLGMLDKMQEHAIRVVPKNRGTVIDVCGTGGDRLGTFNVSTTASFVAAASGGVVAKHGNRSSSGVSGSADIFEYFGYDLDQSPQQVSEVLGEFNICFMFAQKFHPAMRHVASARRRIGGRTAFNLLGPLSNPAQVRNQLIGVSSSELLCRLPRLLKRRGAQNIMTVRSDDGMDEFSTSSVNRVCTMLRGREEGKVMTDAVDPEALGLHKSRLQDIQVGTKEEAIKSFVSVLDGTANRAMIETTVLNSAAALIVGDVAEDFDEGVRIAGETIQSGRAFGLLRDFVGRTGSIEKLNEVRES